MILYLELGHMGLFYVLIGNPWVKYAISVCHHSTCMALHMKFQCNHIHYVTIKHLSLTSGSEPDSCMALRMKFECNDIHYVTIKYLSLTSGSEPEAEYFTGDTSKGIHSQVRPKPSLPI